MPRMSASKEEVSGQQELLPVGPYEVILKGFNPVVSKKGDSINLNPDIRVINHPTLNDKKIFVSMNTNAPFMWAEICHAFGCPLEDDGSGELSIPGAFDGVDFASALALGPKKRVPWQYNGPLLNQQGRLLLGQVIRDGSSKPQNDVQQYICRVSGCETKHSDNLIKS
jgi:hypothetical protein